MLKHLTENMFLWVLLFLFNLTFAQSGICGSTKTACSWKYDSASKILTITGNGAMSNYNYRASPWYSYHTEIATVSIAGVTSIGRCAFYNCTSLQSIVIPNSVTSIEIEAFMFCVSAKSLVISNKLTSINSCVFAELFSLESVIIPDSVTSIGDYAFAGCHSLKEIKIPEGVISIGACAFANCFVLEFIEIPISNKIYYIKPDSFLLFNDSVTLLLTGNGPMKDYTYSDISTSPWFYIPSSFKYISIQNGITSVGNYNFYGMTKIESIIIPSSVTSIGNYAFYDCSSLKTISDGIHSFGSYSLSNTAIEGLVIGNGNEEDQRVFIDENAFSNCKNLTSVIIKPRFKSEPNDTSIKSCSIQKYAFNNCLNIDTFIIDGYVDEVKEYAFSFNEINNVNFQYKSLSSPQICSNLDPNNETLLLPIFSENASLIKVPMNYQSNIFCPCDKLGCPISYIENEEHDKIQNASVQIEKTLNEEIDGSNSSENSSNNPSTSDNGSSLDESNEGSSNESSSFKEDESSSDDLDGSSSDEPNESSSNESSSFKEDESSSDDLDGSSSDESNEGSSNESSSFKEDESSSDDLDESSSDGPNESSSYKEDESSSDESDENSSNENTSSNESSSIELSASSGSETKTSSSKESDGEISSGNNENDANSSSDDGQSKNIEKSSNEESFTETSESSAEENENDESKAMLNAFLITFLLVIMTI